MTLPERDPRILEFVERLKADDDSVLAEVLEEYGTALDQGLVSRFGRSLRKEDRDDILSMTLYRLWVNRDRYDPSKLKLIGWLYILGRSVALDLLRQRARESSGSTELAPVTTREVRLGPGVNEAIKKFMATLAEEDRLIALRYAETGGRGHWAADLAGELGLSAGTIRVRRFRLWRRLRRELSRYVMEETT